jgi:copper chaperone
MTQTSTLQYIVAGMSCGHCVKAVSDEVGHVPGVSDVKIDLDTKLVTVSGAGVDDAAVRAAIVEAGYEAS